MKCYFYPSRSVFTLENHSVLMEIQVTQINLQTIDLKSRTERVTNNKPNGKKAVGVVVFVVAYFAAECREFAKNGANSPHVIDQTKRRLIANVRALHP